MNDKQYWTVENTRVKFVRTLFVAGAVVAMQTITTSAANEFDSTQIVELRSPARTADYCINDSLEPRAFYPTEQLALDAILKSGSAKPRIVPKRLPSTQS